MWILNLLSGGLIGQVGRELNTAYANKLAAENTESKIEADVTIAELEARRALLIEESKYTLTGWIRPAFALPFVLFNLKVIVWDKMLGLGVTPDLSPEFWQLQMIVFGCYFLTRPVEKILKK